MDIREIPLIQQSVFESTITSIDNFALVNELNKFYSNPENSQNLADVRFPEAGPETLKLENEISLRVNTVAQKQMICKQFWMLSMSSGGSVPQHNHKNNYQLHPEEYYSVAYYPSAPEGGANIHFYASYCNTMQKRIVVKSSVGKLVIFNSYLDHYTDRHWSDDPRICISANYKPAEPDKTVVSDWSSFAQPGYLNKAFLGTNINNER
jgi:hypothetical protein